MQNLFLHKINKPSLCVLSSVGRTSVPLYASLVQLVERRSPKPDVEGSSPSGRDFKKGKENGKRSKNKK